MHIISAAASVFFFKVLIYSPLASDSSKEVHGSGSGRKEDGSCCKVHGTISSHPSWVNCTGSKHVDSPDAS